MAIDLSQATPSVQWPTSPEANGIISPLVSGNYITPEQAKSMRDYADALTKYSQKMPVKNGWQGLAQMANALMGGALSNYADKQSRDVLNQGRSRALPLANTLDSVTGDGTPTASSDSTGAAPTQTAAYTPSKSGMDEVDQLKENIASRIESRGNYNAIGPDVKRPDGSIDHAYGKFQVMGSNIPAWTQEVLGRTMTPEEFLKDPNAQEAVTAAKLGQYYQKTGNLQDAASMWFTGRPLAQGANAKDVNGMTGSRYAQIATAGITPSAKPVDTARVATQADVLRDNAEGDRKIASGAVAAAVNGAPTDKTEAPTAAAYAPDGSAPALSAINSSAPTQAPAPIQPNPYQIAALRGQKGPMLNGSNALSIMMDPSVPENVRTMAQKMVDPQTIQGPFGTSYLTSTAGALNGSAPKLFANMGQVQPFEIGKIKGSTYSRLNPANGDVSRDVLMPGNSINIYGHPAMPQGRGGPPQPSPMPQGGETGGYAPKFPTNPNLDTLREYDIQSDAMGKAAEKDAENASEAAKASQANIPAIRNVKNNLNQVKGYMNLLAQNKDKDTMFGPLADKNEEVMGVLSQLGIVGKDAKDALGNYQAVKKGLAQIITAQSQALEGNNGKALAAGIHLAEQASPNPHLTYQGLAKTMDSLEKVMDYREAYEMAKQDWINNHHTLNGFDREWSKGVEGGQSSIPTARPYALTSSPIETKTLPDGRKIMKVPSTHAKGWTTMFAPTEE